MSLTSCTDSRIGTDRSLRMSSVTEAGSCSRMRRQQRLDRVDDLDDVRAGLLLDRQVDAALAVRTSRGLVVLDAVVDVRDLVEPHGVAVAVGDDRRPVRRRLAAAGRWSGRRRSVVAVDGAGRQIDVGVGDRGRHLVDADRPWRRACADRRRCARRTSATPKTLTCATPLDHRDALRDVSSARTRRPPTAAASANAGRGRMTGWSAGLTF